MGVCAKIKWTVVFWALTAVLVGRLLKRNSRVAYRDGLVAAWGQARYLAMLQPPPWKMHFAELAEKPKVRAWAVFRTLRQSGPFGRRLEKFLSPRIVDCVGFITRG